MTDIRNPTDERGQFSDDDFYLPAMTLPPNFGRIEDIVTDLFDFHGVVLIPDSYNK
ncbi:MAG: hypothetical protein ABEH86_10690 [Haloarcula sp.]